MGLGGAELATQHGISLQKRFHGVGNGGNPESNDQIFSCELRDCEMIFPKV
jgi:hypothetical protein